MQPVSEGSLPVGERIVTLDVLRGFALLGILIMNMPGFATSFFAEADGSHLWPGAVDQWAGNVRDMLFSGKFNSMFSLLLIFHFNRAPGPSPVKFLGSLCCWTSRPAMMLFYVLAIVRLAQLPAWQRAFAPLAAAGRMPLTNYLMQTAICTTLFYGWGFGLWGRVGPAAGLALAAVVFFAVQVPWSLWWLARHERGPLEALWARLTYGTPARARTVAAR